MVTSKNTSETRSILLWQHIVYADT